MLQNEFENIGYNELMKQWKNKRKLLDELEEVKTLKEKSFEAFDVYKKFENLYLKKRL